MPTLGLASKRNRHDALTTANGRDPLQPALAEITSSAPARFPQPAPPRIAPAMTDLALIGGLFLAAFLAATILPAQSEAALVGLLLAGDVAPWLLVGVASLGNVLGAVVNWWLGRQVERFRGRRWFPVSDGGLARARGWYHRYGRWSLLFSWVPIVGDPLTVVAGTMREPLASFLPLVAIGKVGRYVALAAGTLGWMAA